MKQTNYCQRSAQDCQHLFHQQTTTIPLTSILHHTPVSLPCQRRAQQYQQTVAENQLKLSPNGGNPVLNQNPLSKFNSFPQHSHSTVSIIPHPHHSLQLQPPHINQTLYTPSHYNTQPLHNPNPAFVSTSHLHPPVPQFNTQFQTNLPTQNPTAPLLKTSSNPNSSPPTTSLSHKHPSPPSISVTQLPNRYDIPQPLPHLNQVLQISASQSFPPHFAPLSSTTPPNTLLLPSETLSASLIHSQQASSPQNQSRFCKTTIQNFPTTLVYPTHINNISNTHNTPPIYGHNSPQSQPLCRNAVPALIPYQVDAQSRTQDVCAITSRVHVDARGRDAKTSTSSENAQRSSIDSPFAMVDDLHPTDQTVQTESKGNQAKGKGKSSSNASGMTDSSPSKPAPTPSQQASAQQAISNLNRIHMRKLERKERMKQLSLRRKVIMDKRRAENNDSQGDSDGGDDALAIERDSTSSTVNSSTQQQPTSSHHIPSGNDVIHGHVVNEMKNDQKSDLITTNEIKEPVHHHNQHGLTPSPQHTSNTTQNEEHSLLYVIL